MAPTLSRRRLLQGTLVAAGSSLLSACGSSTPPQQATPVKPQNQPKRPTMNTQPTAVNTPRSAGDNTMRIFASSGFCEDPARIQAGLDRLAGSGFQITNHTAAYRRFQRFAGSDAERINDLQDVALGRVSTPKVLMGARGGYGAVRLLPHIDWGRLGARMREQQTLLFGFSDVTAIQLALLSQSGMPSFAGPMLYSEFAKPTPDTYTMDSFIRTTTASELTVAVPTYQAQRPRAMEGMLWGGNLSVLASLVGTPYMPKVQGGILFLEDVAEQPYRIERMLQTLHLAGILRSQQAIVLGDFRMGNIRDSYDSSYDLNTVAQTMSRVANVPVLSGFPFGHITNKTTFPLGAHARIQPDSVGGYQITFSGYPTLNPNALNLSALLPPPVFDFSAESGEVGADSEF
ncbi:LD-carboxypeptidase [Kingella negevensis]|uniref:LD-carboxypeptidase n=1 Tax=Kingella negevensis TaxID=1522312 RepID=UPI00050A2A14|nr:LD-carboxypeptidase [Kingella negevensis]MDK4689276.1 LD-carboxypeptidase [Kingella negevensis]WII91371.1 LD-carboxypeptidase [Kingella negevensis]